MSLDDITLAVDYFENNLKDLIEAGKVVVMK